MRIFSEYEHNEQLYENSRDMDIIKVVSNDSD